MADPHNMPTRQRPGVVTISSYLLIFFAVLQVISLIISLSTLSAIREVYREAFAGTSAEGVEGFAIVAGIVGAVIGLLIAAGLVVLALLNNRGKNASRIVTWVVGGIALCCTGGVLISSALGNMMGGPAAGDVPSQEEINRRLEAALPSWYEPVTTLLSVLGILALLAALILLALPPANEFFRKPTPVWEPPLPGTTYPGYPQAPGQPGYPQAPGQPGYPQAPGQPGYPQAPGQPGYPQAPGHPPVSGQPGQPSTPGQPPSPDQPGERQPGSDRPGPTPPPMS